MDGILSHARTDPIISDSLSRIKQASIKMNRKCEVQCEPDRSHISKEIYAMFLRISLSTFRKYVFAPKCRGVSAKRSGPMTDEQMIPETTRDETK
jgi:hypothetical protein